jgi:hypothetical protein
MSRHTADTPTTFTEPIRFDTKIAVLLRDDLEPWQRLNVTSFLVSGLGSQVPEVIGEPYEDADGVAYLPMFRQPVMVFEATKEVLVAAHARALPRPAACRLHVGPLRHRQRPGQPGGGTGRRHGELDVVGLAVYGPRNGVDKVVKGARMHP